MELSEDDVLHILKLIDESKFDYFQLEVGELKITVSKGDPIPLGNSAPPVATSAAPAAAAPAVAPKPAPAPAASRTAPKAAAIPAGHRRRHGTDPWNFLCGARTRRAAICDRRPASH